MKRSASADGVRQRTGSSFPMDAPSFILRLSKTLAEENNLGNPAPLQEAFARVDTKKLPPDFEPFARQVKENGASTTLASVVRNVLAPHYAQRIADAIGDEKFSLYVAVADSAKRVPRIGVLAKFLNRDQKKMCTVSLGMFDVKSRTRSQVLEGLDHVLNLFSLKWENLVGISCGLFGFTGDPEEDKPFIEHLHEKKNPRTICVKRACQASGVSLVCTFQDDLDNPSFVYSMSEFYRFVRRGGFPVECMMGHVLNNCMDNETVRKVEEAIAKLQGPIVTRFGYLFPCAQILAAMGGSARGFFYECIHDMISTRKGVKDLEKYFSFSSNITEIVCISECLQKLEQFWNDVEEGKIGLLDAGSAIKETIEELAKLVLPPEKNVLANMKEDIADACYYNKETLALYSIEKAHAAAAAGEPLEKLTVYLMVPALVDFIKDSSNNRRYEVVTETKNSRKVVCYVIEHLRGFFADQIETLEQFKALKPAGALNLTGGGRLSISGVAKTVYGSDVDPALLDNLICQWSRLPDYEQQLLKHRRDATDVDPVRFWLDVLELKSADGANCFKELAKLALEALTLPFASGEEERILNSFDVIQMKLETMTADDAALTLVMTNAELIVREAGKLFSLQKDQLVDLLKFVSRETGKEKKPLAAIEFPAELLEKMKNEGYNKVASSPFSQLGMGPDIQAPPLTSECSWDEICFDEVKKIVESGGAIPPDNKMPHLRRFLKTRRNYQEDNASSGDDSDDDASSTSDGSGTSEDDEDSDMDNDRAPVNRSAAKKVKRDPFVEGFDVLLEDGVLSDLAGDSDDDDFGF